MSIAPYLRYGVCGLSLLMPFDGGVQSGERAPANQQRTPVLRVFLSPGFLVDGLQSGAGGEIVPSEPELSEATLVSDPTGPCTSTAHFAVGGASPYAGPASVSWLVKASLVAVEQDRATIDVRWQRTVHRPASVVESDLTMEQRLTLRDGASGIIDFVRAAPGVEDVCANVAVSCRWGSARLPTTSGMRAWSTTSG